MLYKKRIFCSFFSFFGKPASAPQAMHTFTVNVNISTYEKNLLNDCITILTLIFFVAMFLLNFVKYIFWNVLVASQRQAKQVNTKFKIYIFAVKRCKCLFVFLILLCKACTNKTKGDVKMSFEHLQENPPTNFTWHTHNKTINVLKKSKKIYRLLHCIQTHANYLFSFCLT